jgi:CHAD domain-containing protein
VELRPHEPIRKALRRTVRRQLRGAVRRLCLQGEDSPDTAIHEARRHLKFARALLRLAEPSLRRGEFRREDRRLRDAGRLLSPARDATILTDAVARLRPVESARAENEALDALAEKIATHAAQIRRREVERRHVLSKAARKVRKARRRAARWGGAIRGWSDLKRGLRKSYTQARNAFLAAQGCPSVARRHEWRQQSKHVRFQLELLRAVDPQAMGALIDQAKRLGDLLGEDHDLAVLDEWLGRQQCGAEQAHCATIERLIARRQESLFDEAAKLGEQFFAGCPGDFVRLLSKSWKAWRRSGGRAATA